MNVEDLGECGTAGVWEETPVSSMTLLWEENQPGRAHSVRTCPLGAQINELWVTWKRPQQIHEWDKQSLNLQGQLLIPPQLTPNSTHAAENKPSHVQPKLRHRILPFWALPFQSSHLFQGEVSLMSSLCQRAAADLGWAGHPGSPLKTLLRNSDKLCCHDLKMILNSSWRGSGDFTKGSSRKAILGNWQMTINYPQGRFPAIVTTRVTQERWTEQNIYFTAILFAFVPFKLWI